MSRRLSTAQIAAIALLAVFTVFITWRAKRLDKQLRERTSASLMTNKQAPDFSLPSLEGQTVSLRDFKGKKLVISYWASWCGPCRIELPMLREFYKKHHSDGSDFEVLAVSVDEDRSAAEEYATREKLPFPILLDPASKAAGAYSVEAIPTMFVIDKDGKILFATTGVEPALEARLSFQLGIRNANGQLNDRSDAE